MNEVERLCERVIIMKKGRIEDDDTPERLLARYGRETLEEVFLDVARGRRQQRGRAMSAQRYRRRISPLNRVAAMVRRYWYLLRSSWPRILDLIYWPAVQMLMWGFLQLYISQNAGFFARPAASSSARCCCGIFCSAASSVSRFRSSRKCTRATSAT